MLRRLKTFYDENLICESLHEDNKIVEIVTHKKLVECIKKICANNFQQNNEWVCDLHMAHPLLNSNLTLRIMLDSGLDWLWTRLTTMVFTVSSIRLYFISRVKQKEVAKKWIDPEPMLKWAFPVFLELCEWSYPTLHPKLDAMQVFHNHTTILFVKVFN